MATGKLLAAYREPLRRAAPLTPELSALRNRGMVWCAIGIFMLLTNSAGKSPEALTVLTYLMFSYAIWLLYRYMRGQLLNDIDFWTPARMKAWDAGERDMGVIAAMAEEVEDPEASRIRATPEARAPALVPSEPCCCCPTSREGRPVE